MAKFDLRSHRTKAQIASGLIGALIALLYYYCALKWMTAHMPGSIMAVFISLGVLFVAMAGVLEIFMRHSLTLEAEYNRPKGVAAQWWPLIKLFFRALFLCLPYAALKFFGRLLPTALVRR